MTQRTALLTGYPTFTARRMLELLLGRGHSVYLLVQDKFHRQAKEYVDSLALPEVGQKVELMVGDVMDLDLGLSGAEIREILDNVELVYHMAGIYYLGVDARTTHHVNVEGTRTMLELAAGMRSLERFTFMSTAFVAGMRQGVIREEDLYRGQRFRNEYERSKLEAEKLCRRAMSTIPVSVVRPSIIVGDSTTGEIDKTDGPYYLINAIVNLPVDIHIPLPGRGDHPLNMVPVDYVVAATYHISRDPTAVGRTFHLTDPNPLSARQVFEIVAKKAGRKPPRGTFPVSLSKALLRIPGIGRLTQNPRLFLHQFNQLVIFNNAGALEVLSKTGLTCPPFEAYAENLVSYVKKVGQEGQRSKS